MPNPLTGIFAAFGKNEQVKKVFWTFFISMDGLVTRVRYPGRDTRGRHSTIFFPNPRSVYAEMITLRPIRDADIPLIKKWPLYPPEFAGLDYCLRDGGWLDQYRGRPGTVILVAVEGPETIGFSVLSRDGPGKKEFRMALHPGRIGRGVGRTILRRTLEYCFADMTITAVRLIVRKNNLRAQKLYISMNFRPTGECTKDIHGSPVQFFSMEIDRRTFFLGNRS